MTTTMTTITTTMGNVENCVVDVEGEVVGEGVVCDDVEFDKVVVSTSNE